MHAFQRIIYEMAFVCTQKDAQNNLSAEIEPNLRAIERNLPAFGFIKGGKHPSAADLALFDLYSSTFPGLLKLGVDMTPYPKVRYCKPYSRALPPTIQALPPTCTTTDHPSPKLPPTCTTDPPSPTIHLYYRPPQALPPTCTTDPASDTPRTVFMI